MAARVIGRDATLVAAQQAMAGPGVVLEGPAGIGKTAVWQELLAQTTDATTLVAAPAESERLLPYAALADLLRPLTHLIPDLPPPQRAAAEMVTATAPVIEPVDERTVGVAVRSLLEGAGPPLLIAVDDCQWLDVPSARALRYTLRRLTDRPRLLLSRRTETDAELPLGLDQLRPPPDQVRVPPLGIGALHHILQDRLGVVLPRPVLTRITAESGGNPLLAIEIGRAVLRLPELPRPGDDLPVARSVQELLGQSLTSMPVHTRDALRLAALLSTPTLSTLRAAGVVAQDLDPAEEAGIIRVTGTALRFGHPLQAAVVRAGIPDGVRRRLQTRLAAVVADPDERARQLARATVEPDARVAAELEASGHRQWARGVPDLAAELLHRAAALTPEAAPEDRDRRLISGLRARYDSGDHPATDAAAARAVESLTGDARAEALLIRAVVAFVTRGHTPAARLAQQALAAATPGSTLAGRIHAHLGVFEDRPEAAARHGELALELLSDRPADRDMRCSAMLMQFYNEVRAGRPPRTELLERALRLERDEPSWLAGSIPGLWWTAVDDHPRAWQRMHRQLDHARAKGDEPLQLEVLLHLVQSQMLAGRWSAAERNLAQATDLGEQLGADLAEQDYLAAQLGIYRGDLDGYEPLVRQRLGQAEQDEDPWARRVYGLLAGQLALHRAHFAEAAGVYAQLWAQIRAQGLVEPLALRWEPDWIEACVGAGDLVAAGQVLDRLAQRHSGLPRPWTELGLHRSRVLVLAAGGADASIALAGLQDRLDALPADVLPLDRARCLLVAGLAHRRARRRGQARTALTAALAGFEALGANAFAARTRAELDRVGVRATEQELTATELRVATLAARGATNKTIAETLFISPKTVEANLARAYRKLGITSRAELGATLGRPAP